MHRSNKRGNTSLDAGARPWSGAAVALLIGALYLWWRTTTLGSGWFLALSAPLLALEVWSWLELALFAAQTWRLPPSGPRGDAGGELDPVDIVIDAHGADIDELERTLLAVRSVRSRGRIVVIDHARRFRHRRVASDAGATYWIDPRIADAPGLAVHRASTAERYVWLRAGQIPMPDLLEVVAPRFQRDDLAVCQLAISLLNAEDLAHLGRDRDDDVIENEVVGPALARWRAAPWLGPASVVRRRAIDDVGAFDAEPSLERVAARLHASGWATDFERRKLVASAAPESLEHYLALRRQRAAATWRVLVSADGPLARSSMRPTQRLAHLAAAARFASGPRLLLLTAALVGVLLSGRFPIDAPLAMLMPFWGAATLSGALARRSLARGAVGLGDHLRQSWRTIGAEVAALGDVVRRRRRSVDTAGRSGPVRGRATSGWRGLAGLPLLDGIVLLVDLAILARAATLVDRDLLPPFPGGQRVVVIGFAIGLLVPIAQVLQVVLLRKQRRAHHRVQAALDATIDGSPATTVDLTPGGVGLVLREAPEVGTEASLEVALPGVDGVTRRIVGRAIVRSARPDGADRWRVGLEFTQLAAPARQALMSYCTTAARDGVDDGGTVEVIDPLTASARRRRQGLRRVTLAAGLAGLATMVFGPGIAAAETATPELVDRVCVVDPAGGPVAGVGVERLVAGEERLLGTTDGIGCLAVAVEATTVGFAVVIGEDRYVAQPSDYAGASLRVDLVAWEAWVVDLDGEPVPAATVRFHLGRWVPAPAPATPGDPNRLVGLPVGPEGARAVEVGLDGARHVRPLGPGTSEVVVLSRISIDPAAADAEPLMIDRGSGWEPIVDGSDFVPGPTVIRLVDGRVLRIDVPESHRLVLPSGDLVPVEVERPTVGTTTTTTTITTTTGTATSTTSIGTATSTTAAGTATSPVPASTSATSSTPTNASAVEERPPTDPAAGVSTTTAVSTTAVSTTAALATNSSTSEPAGRTSQVNP